MEVTVYADMYFIVNFMFDTLFLYITARITNTPFKPPRLILGGVLGAAYGFFCLTVASSLILHLAAAFVICFAVFGKNRPFVNTSVFIMSACLTGGLVYGLYFLSSGKLSGSALFLSSLTAVGLSALYLYICNRNSRVGSVFAYITVLGREYKAFLLKDSGNLLTDPLSADPVMVIRKTVFGKAEEWLDVNSPKVPIRIIPVKTAAGSDILYGFKPEKCVVREFGKKAKRSVTVVVALSDTDSFSGTYDGLMPPI